MIPLHFRAGEAVRKSSLVTDGEETFISTDFAHLRARVDKQLPSAGLDDFQSKAIAKTNLLKRKARKYSYGAIVSHIVIIGLIVGMIGIGYQPPVKSAGLVNSVADLSSLPASAPTVDQVASVNMAAVAAQTANIVVKDDVINDANSINILSQLSQTETSVVSKPQILTANSGAHGVSVYVTKQGDSVTSVAAASGISAETIRWANGLVSDALTPGTSLKIPAIDGVVYTVRTGDTPASLAAKYNADANRITTYNNAELSGLQPGQQIIIPGGTLPVNERPGYVSRNRSYNTSFAFASYGSGYPSGQCTWWAYNRRAQLGRPVGGNWGNANTWDIAARMSGFRVDSTPEVGAVMQTAGDSYWGHVGVVERINGDGTLFISEYNYLGSGYHTRTVNPGGYNYIH